MRARVSYQDDLLVIGSSAQWKYGSYGAQEKQVLELQRRGSSIQIIDQDGFFAIIDGGWAYPLPPHSEPVEYPDGLLPYRPVDPTTEVSGYAWETTGEALTEAVNRHRQLQGEVAERLDQTELVPLSPALSDCAFDVAWKDAQGTLHVVEIKSLSRIPIMRLGIGQALDYATTLRATGHVVVAHLLVGGPPDDVDHWLAVAAAARVRLSWNIDDLLHDDQKA